MFFNNTRLFWMALFFGGIFNCALIHGQTNEFIEPEMVNIPEGKFIYGNTELERQQFLISHNEPAAKKISLPAFWIGKYEVTNKEYACFIDDGGYENKRYWSEAGWSFCQQLGWKEPRRWRDKDYNSPKKENYPVCAVSWYEAKAFCRWLSEKSGKSYRLPTEQEWEKAARGDSGKIFPWGDEWNSSLCNWLGDTNGDNLPNHELDGFLYTAPVDHFSESQSTYGCFNMAGNVLEWCNTEWNSSKKNVKQTIYKVYKGGSFFSGEPRLLRCSWRGGTYPEIGHVYWGITGFRAAMNENEKLAEYSYVYHF